MDRGVLTVHRAFKTFFRPAQLQSYQRGVMRYEYRGIPCLKSPIDIAIYLRLIHDSGCRTIIEIGSKAGGSALMFRDFARSIRGEKVSIVSIDLQKPEIEFEGVRFLRGDVCDLSDVFAANNLWSLPRPWLVVEDSAHTAVACASALAFFAMHLQAGEWLVIEDGSLEELGLADRYDGGPNEAIAAFFQTHPRIFEVGEQYCDMFGRNATYNPNGYLRRTDTPLPPPSIESAGSAGSTSRT
jgi:cephalosporin hydroxylase